MDQVITKLIYKIYVLLFTANIVVLRTYCSEASWENERTTVMSFLTAMQAIAFILGPGDNQFSSLTFSFSLPLALGLLFQPLGDDGVEWDAIQLHFNLYTGPGFLGIFLCLINIILIIFFFKEFDVHGSKRIKSFKKLCNFCCQYHTQESEKKRE